MYEIRGEHNTETNGKKEGHVFWDFTMQKTKVKT